MDVWAWISELQNSDQWTESESDPQHVFDLATQNDWSSTRSIRLKAERTSGSGVDSVVAFTLYLHGFDHVSSENNLWVSDTCLLSSEKPFLPLVLQLLQETISRSPTAHDTTSPRCPRSQLQKLKPEVVSWIMESHCPESFGAFFAVALLTRLFFLCAFDGPAAAGLLFFRGCLGPALEAGLINNSPALRTFFATAGVDAELCFTRSVSYMLAKWCVLRDTDDIGLRILAPKQRNANGRHGELGFSYAGEGHGFWTLKGYAPVPGMKLTRGGGSGGVSSGDLVLKYALAHQQLEAVIQLEYSVGFYQGLIQVNARVDNLRLNVVRLGYNKDNEDTEFSEERHFPSRIRVWVGPEVGANYVEGMSLGRSTGDQELDEDRAPETWSRQGAKPKPRTRRRRSWRWDQDVEGNAAVFEAVLCDRATGREVAGGAAEGLRGRYGGAERPFTKSGGVVLAGDEYGEGVGWRVRKDMEGSVFKWRIGGKVWVTYCPNEVNASLFETRCVDWCDEVDLPLIPAKLFTF